MGLMSTTLADSDMMMNDKRMMNSNNSMMKSTSMEMSVKDKMKMKIETRLSNINLSTKKIDIVLMRIEAFRDKMDASSLSMHKMKSYNMILDALEEVLKEKKMMMNGEMMMDDMPTIAEAAMMKDEFSTLVTALKAADLAETLMGEGPFTVFAPDNAAFDKVDAETLEMLLEEENMEMLQEILTYHVVSGTYMASDITDGLMLETVNGAELTFTIENGMVMIDGDTTVTMADMVKSNGVVHKIDMVLMP